MQESRQAVWLADGQVGVPLARIAERWLQYYWPLFASELFIPQSQSEGAGSNLFSRGSVSLATWVRSSATVLISGNLRGFDFMLAFNRWVAQTYPTAERPATSASIAA
jgi:hypothetical protein